MITPQELFNDPEIQELKKELAEVGFNFGLSHIYHLIDGVEEYNNLVSDDFILNYIKYEMAAKYISIKFWLVFKDKNIQSSSLTLQSCTFSRLLSTRFTFNSGTIDFIIDSFDQFYNRYTGKSFPSTYLDCIIELCDANSDITFTLKYKLSDFGPECFINL